MVASNSSSEDVQTGFGINPSGGSGTLFCCTNSTGDATDGIIGWAKDDRTGAGGPDARFLVRTGSRP